MNDYGFIPIKLYVQKQIAGHISPGGHSLPTQVKTVKKMILICFSQVGCHCSLRPCGTSFCPLNMVTFFFFSSKNDMMMQRVSMLIDHVVILSQKWLSVKCVLPHPHQFLEDNLGVMSVGFLLSSPDDAVIWRGPKKNGLPLCFLPFIASFQGQGCSEFPLHPGLSRWPQSPCWVGSVGQFLGISLATCFFTG